MKEHKTEEKKTNGTGPGIENGNTGRGIAWWRPCNRNRDPQNECSDADKGIEVGETCALGTKHTFGPAPRGCWRPGGV